MPKVFARIGMEVEIPMEDLKKLIDYSSIRASDYTHDKFMNLHNEVMEVVRKYFNPTGIYDSYIPGDVLAELVYDYNLDNGNCFNDINF